MDINKIIRKLLDLKMLVHAFSDGTCSQCSLQLHLWSIVIYARSERYVCRRHQDLRLLQN
jgi:hypothetical protein